VSGSKQLIDNNDPGLRGDGIELPSRYHEIKGATRRNTVKILEPWTGVQGREALVCQN
jgi:hypothetical protein